MKRFNTIHSLLWLAGILLAFQATGCGTKAAETDAPVSAQEQEELQDQLQTLEKEGQKG